MLIAKKNIRLSIVFVLVCLFIYFIWCVRSALYPFVLAIIMSYLLNPVVSSLEKKGLTRTWAIVIVYILILGTAFVGLSKFIPVLVRELENFGQELPQITAAVQELIQNLQFKYQNSALPYTLRLSIDKVFVSLEYNIHSFINSLVAGIISMMSHLIGILLAPILAFYLLHDWYHIKEELLYLIPSKWRSEIILVVKDVDKVLSGVIRGQVTVAIIVGVLVSTGLYLLKLKYAFIIGMLAGILDVIPYFGAVIGATPAVTLALLYSPWLAVKIIVLFILIHQIEGTIIQPYIVGEKVGLHPLSVIFFVFVGGELGGLLGMLLGVPVAAIIKVLLKHLIKILV